MPAGVFGGELDADASDVKTGAKPGVMNRRCYGHVRHKVSADERERRPVDAADGLTANCHDGISLIIELWSALIQLVLTASAIFPVFSYNGVVAIQKYLPVP